jgi:H+/Cl- antiporter ClcA
MPGDLTAIGRWVIGLSLAGLIVGGAIWLAGKLKLPLGRLPGDLHFQSGSLTCFIPLATTLILSLLLTLVLNILLRLLGR